MTQPFVLYAVEQGIATLTLNDGARMNPLGDEIAAALASAIGRVREDGSVQAVVLTAQGRAFCAGADLPCYMARLERPEPGQSLGQYVGELMEAKVNPLILALRELPVPVVCAINGVAAGGGFGLALAGDVVLAARSAYFYLPFFPALGAVPDMGASWALPRAVGRARALGLALTGDKLAAQKAADWGLIWDCVEDDQLQAEAQRMARQLAALPAHAIQEARALFAAAETHTLEQQLRLERERQEVLIDGESFAEGVRAFVERRKPVFRRR
ncbi:enoyl-CoA hydratase-related protein [Hydrogenophaga laconesensis]|uniref:2-(1,2-epoxy-1,2-dihydrophenyl)acetyl-CoA isomerase n=1 Tax=Hydrogenophaga laconesensis TaxID=1805971 RepID=A0ABU1V6K0_9BURK|nr:enoyl-CoA hydratase-related protein [Hydrogenophaga laconesensis]MDR7093086.1 2-(1,2-epoxy-1,2-dihydrophenyl)acetyl-CoA isomerase [Hydrogenophaga laconesensis]